MSKMFLKIGIGMLVAVSLTLVTQAAVPGAVKRLSGHVPKAVANLAVENKLEATKVLNLAISVPVHDQAALDARLQQISDPTSPNYQKYLTPAEFAAEFGSTESNYQAVIDFAKANGLTVTATHPNRLLVDVTGSVADIEKVFKIQLNVYKHPKESRTFYAPTTDPEVSASLPILHVSGLDNYYLPHPKMIPKAQNSNGSTSPKLGSGPGGAYLGSDFRTAYVPGTALTGAGQSVGLLQFDGFFANDIAAYATLIGLTNVPNVTVVPIDGGVAVPGGGNGEVAMDIEMILAMAPGVSNIIVYEAPNPSPWVDLLSRMANDNLAKQLSCSWGGGPPDAAAEQIFQQMALQGQSFYNAVGDTDAFVDSINPAEFPSDSPNITQVGGTVLTTGSGSVYGVEQVWNDRFPRPPGYQGSSGGISTFYSIPTWQQGINMVTNHGSTIMRNMPDVALTALDVWVITDNGQAYSSGGTSSAAPLWAAFTALINQQAAINGKAPVGFINPAIYALAKTSNYTNYFNDVTIGDNTWPSSTTNFFAVPGYDLCTGLGTPHGTSLINALAGVTAPQVIISAPLPPWGTNLSVMNGSNPNGAWFLFVQDDKQYDTGMISNGWFITLTTANPVGYAADSQLYTSLTSTNVASGRGFNFTLAVTNYGPSTATNVFVTDTLPLTGIILVSSNMTAGTVAKFGTALTWNVGNLPINTGATLTLNFTANATGIYTNRAIVDATTSDPNPDDNTADTLVTVNTALPPSITPSFTSGAGGGFHLAVTANTSATTIIQASTNLVDWVNVYTNTPPFTFTDSNTGNYPARFYRALTP